MNPKVMELDKLAKQVVIYLVLTCLISFVLGFMLLGTTGRTSRFLAVALIGFSGSAIAALTSCLNRYANGFELDGGAKYPEKAKGETFNRRMAGWFYGGHS
jgi:hypothetical protein